jgi:hypothetical protein
MLRRFQGNTFDQLPRLLISNQAREIAFFGPIRYVTDEKTSDRNTCILSTGKLIELNAEAT